MRVSVRYRKENVCLLRACIFQFGLGAVSKRSFNTSIAGDRSAMLGRKASCTSSTASLCNFMCGRSGDTETSDKLLSFLRFSFTSSRDPQADTGDRRQWVALPRRREVLDFRWKETLIFLISPIPNDNARHRLPCHHHNLYIVLSPQLHSSQPNSLVPN
jgi:hypothetical protein